VISVACPICRNHSNSLFSEQYDHISKELFIVKKCLQCNLLYLDPCPSSAQLSKYYFTQHGHQAVTNGGSLFTLMRRVSFQGEGKNFIPYIDPGVSILDFGSGDGAFAQFCSSQGYFVHMIDVLDGSTVNNENVSYSKIDFSSITPKSLGETIANLKPKPTVAILRHVLEHLIKPQEIIEVFKDSGINKIYTVVPNSNSLFAKIFRGYWYYWDPPRHLTHFNQKSLSLFYESLGYSPLAEGHYGIDEIVCSLHRLIGLRYPNKTQLFNSTAPRGNLAGLSSALSRKLQNTVCWSLVSLEPEKPT